jgi:hypothetical protein
MGTELKESDLGRTQPAADGEPRAKPKPGSLPGNHRNLGQTLGARQLIKSAACGRGDAALTEAWAAGARRAVRA